MRLPHSLRTPAYLGAYGALFACSFWVPFQWGAKLAPPARIDQAQRTSERCGLAMVQPPRGIAATPASENVWTHEFPDRMLLRLDTPLPPLARQWELSATPAPDAEAL